MNIVKKWASYIWPFWAIQFLLLFISSGPGSANMPLWLVLTGGFNLLAFVAAWSVCRSQERNQAFLKQIRDELNKEHGDF